MSYHRLGTQREVHGLRKWCLPATIRVMQDQWTCPMPATGKAASLAVRTPRKVDSLLSSTREFLALPVAIHRGVTAPAERCRNVGCPADWTPLRTVFGARA